VSFEALRSIAKGGRMFFAAGIGKPLMGSPIGFAPSFVVGNVRVLRSPDGWSRRKPAVADRGLGRLNLADSAPTAVASGRTGVRAIAAVAPRARRYASRPNRKFSAPVGLLNATQGESSPVTPPARSRASGNPKETQVAPRSVKRHNYL
jgi:hypothetical protein